LSLVREPGFFNAPCRRGSGLSAEQAAGHGDDIYLTIRPVGGAVRLPTDQERCVC